MNKLPRTHVKACMKHALLLLAVPCLLLASCSIASRHYHPLTSRPPENWQGTSSRWGGFTESQHSPGNYTIGFESYNQPNAEATNYFTLVRAAERAAIDGQKKFYLKNSPVKSTSQRSHFAGYVVEGHLETESVVYEVYDRHGHVHYHTREIYIQHPDTYVPPRTALNSIHKASRQLSYSKKLSAPFDTYRVLSDALHNTRGYGKPKLDPRARAQLKAWSKPQKSRAN